MPTTEMLEQGRVILCHFNSYSVMLQFARFGASILFPELPSEVQSPESLGRCLAERLGLAPEQLEHDPAFEEWLGTPPDAARVHLFRVRTVEPPAESLELNGGTWRQLSELRGIARHELGYARRVFELNMGS